MSISLKKALLEKSYEFSRLGALLAEVGETGEAEDEKADLKKRALVSVATQGKSMQDMAGKLSSAKFASTAVLVKQMGDDLVGLSKQTDLDEEGVQKFVSSRIFAASFVNLLSAISGELSTVGEDKAGSSLANLITNDGKDKEDLADIIANNLYPTPSASKILKKQNTEFANIFKKEDTEEKPAEPSTTSTEPAETSPGETPSTLGSKSESEKDVFEIEEDVIEEEGIGAAIGNFLKKFLSSPPKTAAQTVESLKSAFGGKNIAKVIRDDLAKVPFTGFQKFVTTTKSTFIAANPEKRPPALPEAGAQATPEDANAGAEAAVSNPGIADEVDASVGEDASEDATAAVAALADISAGKDKKASVKGLSPASVQALRGALAILADDGTSADPKKIAGAITKAAPGGGGTSDTLSSVLFVPKTTKKRKMGEKGQAIDSAVKELSTAWDTYTNGDNFPANSRKEIVSKFKAMQDALGDIKTESAKNEDQLLIERWQRLAGIT